MADLTIGGTVLNGMIEFGNDWLKIYYSLIAGSMGQLLSIGFSIYLMIYGYMLIMKGRGNATEFIINMVCFVIVSQFIIDPQGYQLFKYWIFDTVFDTSVMWTTSALGNPSDNPNDIFLNVDKGFNPIFESIQEYKSAKTLNLFNLILSILIPFALFILYCILYATFTSLMILGFFSLYIMFFMAPAIIFFAAFPPTRNFFKNWFNKILGYALTPIFTAIIMSATLTMLKTASIGISMLDNNSLFTKEIGVVFVIGIVSVFMHLRATEYANQIMNTSIGSVGGFITATSSYAMAGAGAIGATHAIRELRSRGYGLMGKGISATASGVASGVANHAPTVAQGIGQGISATAKAPGQFIDNLKTAEQFMDETGKTPFYKPPRK